MVKFELAASPLILHICTEYSDIGDYKRLRLTSSDLSIMAASSRPGDGVTGSHRTEAWTEARARKPNPVSVVAFALFW